jgi:two-component sensor histidine kinase
MQRAGGNQHMNKKSLPGELSSTRLNDGWFRLLGIPLIALMSHLIFYNRNDSGNQAFGFWGIYLISVVETMMIWESVRLVILYFRHRLPSIEQTRQRILWILVCSTLVTMIVRVLNIWVYDKTLLWGYRFPLEGYLHSVFVALLFVLIVTTIYESLYYFRMWHLSSLRAAALKKENLQTQLDSLKSQINPHFLFNNLSSLAALIMENQEKAVHFVEEFSSVFRYLLQANERTLTTLSREMDFISAYYNLLKNRFEQALHLDVEIPDDCNDLLLPPLTVQLLLENAVKHNAAMAENPLQITITASNDGWLLIKNTLHEKNTPSNIGAAHISGLGLENIRAKYRLLGYPAIDISKTATHFEVTVPLIKKENR